MGIKLAKTNIRNQVGGSLLTSILSLGSIFAPTIAKTLGLSALAGLASEGASQVVKKITGRGQTGGAFMIPNNSISDLVNTYNHLLTRKQVGDLARGLARGEPTVLLRLSQKQMGSGLGSILASIGIPIAVDLVSKLIKGKGAPQMGAPPLQWVTEQKKGSKSGKGLLLGKNSPFNSIPVLGQIF